MPRERRVDAREVVVAVRDDVGAIFGRRAVGHGGAPGVRAVVGARGHQHLLPAGRRARDLGRPGADVGAVLGERGPCRPGRERNQVLRQLHPDTPRPVEAVPLRRLVARQEDLEYRALARGAVDEDEAAGLPDDAVDR